MLTKTDLPISNRWKISKEKLQESLQKSYANYSELNGFEGHPGIKYGFGIVLHKNNNIVFVMQTPLEAPITTISANVKISIPSANSSFTIEHDYDIGSGPYGKVLCTFDELFDSTKNFFIDDVLTVTWDGILSYSHADIAKFSCGVCFDEFPVPEKILCGYNSTEAGEQHSFCRGCLVSHAKASTEETQLADGGGGFRCMEHGCKKSIAYSGFIQNLLPPSIKERLDERILEENLAKSGLILESERKLNEAVVRKCECGLQFIKSENCNKMTCRCGITQCYLCREKNIDYTHFCQHEADTACPRCPNKCLLWGDANKFDQTVIDGITAEAAKDGNNLNDNTPVCITS